MIQSTSNPANDNILTITPTITISGNVDIATTVKVPYLTSATDVSGTLIYYKWWNENKTSIMGQPEPGFEEISIKMEGDSDNWDPSLCDGTNANCPWDQIWTSEGFYVP